MTEAAVVVTHHLPPHTLAVVDVAAGEAGNGGRGVGVGGGAGRRGRGAVQTVQNNVLVVIVLLKTKNQSMNNYELANITIKI